MTPEIVVVGSLNMDLVAECERLPRPGETLAAVAFHTLCGGKGGNQAVAAARLGARVAMIGKVGRDAFGAELRAALAREGVDLGGVAEAEGASGVALIGTGAGENLIMVAAGANAALGPADVVRERARLARAAVVLCQLEIPLESVRALAELLAGLPALWVLDPAPAAALDAETLRRVDWLTPNEGEAVRLLGRPGPVDDLPAVSEALRALGPRNVALTLGPRGVFLSGPAVPPTHVPAPAAVAVDSTAAGDTFNGAFATALAEGAAPVAAAQFACRAAAISVSRFGAQASMPDRAQVGDW